MSSLKRDQCVCVSKVESNDNNGLVPFRQFPVIFSSFMVCTDGELEYLVLKLLLI